MQTDLYEQVTEEPYRQEGKRDLAGYLEGGKRQRSKE